MSDIPSGLTPESIAYEVPLSPPYAWEAILRFLRARAVPGVEQVEDGVWSRTFRAGTAAGTVSVSRPGDDFLSVTIWHPETAIHPEVLGLVRNLFRPDGTPEETDSCLRADPVLEPLVERTPGLRVPGGWDPFEIAVRAILGQQVTVPAATTILGRAAAQLGSPMPGLNPSCPGLQRLFPTPAQFRDIEIPGFGVPRGRVQALAKLAAAVAVDPSFFEQEAQALATLRLIPGIGDWTLGYIAMRAFRNPDAFPPGDVVLQRMTGTGGIRLPARELLRRAEAWRPWRASAALHLWTAATIAKADEERIRAALA